MKLLGHDFEGGRCRHCDQHLSDMFAILGFGALAVVMFAVTVALLIVWAPR